MFKKVVALIVVGWLLEYSVTTMIVSPNLPAKYHFQQDSK